MTDKKAEWEKIGGIATRYVCTECGLIVEWYMKTRYCPICKSKMKYWRNPLSYKKVYKI